MLVLSRKVDEAIRVGPDIFFHILRLDGGKVRVGIDAPDHIEIVRTELDAEREVVNAPAVAVTEKA